MKKLLIVLALIIGTSVSAQKIFNLKVNPNGDQLRIVWNTQRAYTSSYQVDSEEEMPIKATPGKPYRVYLDKDFDNVTYLIKAQKGYTKVAREVMIFKVDKNHTLGQYQVSLSIEGDHDLMDRTMYIGNKNLKGIVRQVTIGEYSDGRTYTDLNILLEKQPVAKDIIDGKAYIWFKQNIQTSPANYSTPAK